MMNINVPMANPKSAQFQSDNISLKAGYISNCAWEARQQANRIHTIIAACDCRPNWELRGEAEIKAAMARLEEAKALLSDALDNLASLPIDGKYLEAAE